MPQNSPDRSPRARFFWLWAAVWLFYMAGPISDAWHRPEIWQRAVGLVAAAAFCVIYVVGFLSVRATLRATGRMPSLTRAVVRLGSLTALATVLTLIVGESGLTSLVYIAVIAVFTLPPPAAWGTVL